MPISPSTFRSDSQSRVFNVENYGARPCAFYTDGVSNTSTTFTSATAAFTASDVGKYICIERGGSSQFRKFITTIASVSNATTVILTSATLRSQTSCRFYVSRGGDSLTAIQAAINACTAAGAGSVYMPGVYEISGTIVLKNRVYLEGASRRMSGLFLQGGVNPLGPMIRNDYTSNDGAQFCGVRHMWLDGNTTGNTDNVTTTLSANYVAAAATIDVTSSANFLPSGYLRLTNGGTVTYVSYSSIAVGSGTAGTDRLTVDRGGINGYADTNVTAAGSSVKAYTGHGIYFATVPYANVPTTAEIHDPCHVVDDVYIGRVRGHWVALWSQSETRLNNVYGFSSEQAGFVYGYDTWVTNCTADGAGYAGFAIRNGIGITANCKSFSSGGNDNDKGPGFLVQGIKSIEEGSHSLSACIAQDNYSQGFKIYNAQRVALTGCMASSNSIQGDGSYAGITVDGCTNGIFQVLCCETGHNTGDYQDNALEILNTDSVGNSGNMYAVSHAASAGHAVGTSVKSGSILTGVGQLLVNGADYFFGNDWTPSDHGLLVCSVADPSTCASAVSPVAGVGYYTKVKVPRDITIANVKIICSTAGASGSPANRYVAVYNAAGTRLGASAELTTQWETTGEKTHAITVDGGQSLSVVGSSSQYIWVGFLIGTQYTTPCQFRSHSSSAVVTNFGVTGANVRCGTLGSALTSLPTSITPGSLSATTSGPLGFVCGIT